MSNLQRIARFEKVSYKQFKKDWVKTFKDIESLNEKEIEETYEKITKPLRATSGSAGYDFFSPLNIVLKPNETLKIPTGIRVQIEPGWVLVGFPRSSLGFKYRLQLDNINAVIDQDYYYSEDNEGHIFLKITNDTKEDEIVDIKIGVAFAQGIFLPFGITKDDDAKGTRNGGIGSTTKTTD